ncbi:hypothetical protein M5D96_014147, partial [Drosophila gunungcola]
VLWSSRFRICSLRSAITRSFFIRILILYINEILTLLQIDNVLACLLQFAHQEGDLCQLAYQLSVGLCPAQHAPPPGGDAFAAC